MSLPSIPLCGGGSEFARSWYEFVDRRALAPCHGESHKQRRREHSLPLITPIPIRFGALAEPISWPAIWRFRIASGCSVQVARRSRMDGLMFRIFLRAPFRRGSARGPDVSYAFQAISQVCRRADLLETRTDGLDIRRQGFLIFAHASHFGQMAPDAGIRGTGRLLRGSWTVQRRRSSSSSFRYRESRHSGADNEDVSPTACSSPCAERREPQRCPPFPVVPSPGRKPPEVSKMRLGEDGSPEPLSDPMKSSPSSRWSIECASATAGIDCRTGACV